MNPYYIDCDYIEYEYTDECKEKYHPQYSRVIHPKLNDYTSTCNSGLWRDGSFGNALNDLKNKVTDALHVIKDRKEILTITRETPREMYVLAG